MEPSEKGRKLGAFDVLMRAVIAVHSAGSELCREAAGDVRTAQSVVAVREPPLRTPTYTDIMAEQDLTAEEEEAPQRPSIIIVSDFV
jgi:hypothetical protein